MKNTRVVYQYRDAANYKFPNEIVLKGEMNEKDQKSALDKYGEASDGFDPRKMKSVPSMAPTKGSENYDPELDHPLHELCYFKLTTEFPTDEDYTVQDFFADLKKSAV